MSSKFQALTMGENDKQAHVTAGWEILLEGGTVVEVPWPSYEERVAVGVGSGPVEMPGGTQI